jgi:acetyl esterase/lipase
MLALDPVEQRTYCNTFNLAMLAKLVYSEDATKADSRVPMDNLIPELNSDSRSFSPVETQGTRWRPILRVTEPGHSYLTRNLDSTSKKGQAPREGTTTPDPDGSATPVTFIDTQGRFWEGMSHAVIAMRGTWNMPEDVITDLVAAKVSWPHGSGYVSKGFFLAFEAIRSLLDDRLDHLIQGGKSTVPIFVTGHSLGGALATLVALYIRATRPAHRVILYTFAQPRVVDVTLAERHWADPMLTYYRFESPVDPVPMVPSYRTASDLIRLVGDLPDTLLPRLRDRMTWVAVSHALRGNPIRAILSGWAGSELDGLEQTVDRYKRLMVQIALDQSQGAALPSAEFFAALAAPDLDARHFGVRCRLARKGGRPGVDQAADRAIEQGEEVDHDDLNALLRHTLEGLERAATGAARAKFYEVVTGLKPLVPPDRVQLELDPRAHSMDNYMAHVLFDFEQHLMLVLGKADRRLPFSAGAVERLEHLRFHDHYFGRARFWGDRPEDVDLKAQDGVLVLW